MYKELTLRSGSRIASVLVFWLMVGGCREGRVPQPEIWGGSVDTLVTGQIVVRNPGTGAWQPGEEWRVVEEFRIGSVEGEGADVFGGIFSFAVDRSHRLWVLDGRAQEVRIFGADGAHLRTVGGRGGGPGELSQAVDVDVDGDGTVWITDPGNARISLFDPEGEFQRTVPLTGACLEIPWPGGLDESGHYYALASPECTRLVRFGPDHTPLDTLQPPRDVRARETFVHRTPGGGVIEAEIPFQGGLYWRLSGRGNFWGLLTDEYRLFEMNAAGDTLRTVIREFTPARVTTADRRMVEEELEW
ncbi:MAG: hypothetical protein H0U67_04650, partial [Gemmatimonadetes bacterium]|nr:hypothetical protein [Gemmatimonadota bacterium]